MSRILRALTKPLFVGLCEVAHVKVVERRSVRRWRCLCAERELGKELFGNGRIFSCVERGAAKSFHVNEDGRIGSEDGDGVGNELGCVVGLASSEIPAMADPRKGLCGADVEDV